MSSIPTAAAADSPTATLKNVSRTYRLGQVDVVALHSIDMEIYPNRFTVLSGPSGSGKTSLLNLLGCIDQPNSGEIYVAGKAVQSMSDDDLSDFRAEHIGFIFQTFNLLPTLSAFENVEFPLYQTSMSAAERRTRVLSLLEAVGLHQRADHRPGELSGGQRQRVAIARALVREPKLVLADEPTANLDAQTGTEIISLMRRLQREKAVSFVFSSHDPRVIAEANDIFHILDGRITEVRRQNNNGGSQP